MAVARLTDRQLQALKANGDRLDVWDELVPGFGVRITERGVRTFFVRYRANGSNRRMTLGRYPTLTLAQARDRARKVLTDAAAGADPSLAAQQRKSVDTTFAAMAREVLDARAKTTRLSTRKEREIVLNRHLLPAWKNRPAGSITRRDVTLLCEKIGETAPVQAGKVLAIVRLLYNEAIRRDFPGVTANPAHLLQPAVRPAVRTRFLEPKEIAAVWRATERELPITRELFRFLLLTAQREGAVRALRWSDIVGDVWRTPPEVFKGKRPHLTPLSAEAMATLERVRELTGSSDYVFMGKAGGPRRSIRIAHLSILRASGIAHYTPHDFRRTFRTLAVRSRTDGGLGIAPNIADAVLGHREPSLGFDRYTGEPERYLLSEKRDALAAWGRFVAKVVG